MTGFPDRGAAGTRRALILGLLVAPLPAFAQLRMQEPTESRPAISPGRREGVNEALRRTVTLVLRAEARSNGLPPELSDPAPVAEEVIGSLRTGQRLPEGVEAFAVPDRINRRLPHARGGSVWASVGATLIEIDPVRLTVLSIAYDVLPPET